MNKFTKKLLAIILCAAMAVGTALSTSAMSARTSFLKISNVKHANACMNVYGNNVVSNNRNVCIYTSDGTDAQRWILDRNGDTVYVRSKIDERYALNVDRRSGQNWNCTIYLLEGNQQDAALTTFISYSQNDGTYGSTAFALENYPDMILKADVTSTSFNNLDNIHWVSKSASSDPYTNKYKYHWNTGY